MFQLIQLIQIIQMIPLRISQEQWTAWQIFRYWTVNSELFYQLSQLCHTIQSLCIKFKDEISNGLTDLITLQNNLKHLTIQIDKIGFDWSVIIPSLKKHSDTLIKLKIDGEENWKSFSFISTFKKLQELFILIGHGDIYNDFNQLHFLIYKS